MLVLLISIFIITVLLSLLLTYYSKEVLLNAGRVLPDLHKPACVKVPSPGGIAISISSILGTLVYMQISGYSHKILLACYIGSICSFIGLIDDIIPIGPLSKIVVTGVAFTPISLISVNIVGLPRIIPRCLYPAGSILLGIFVVNASNMVAGFNGLEAGLSSIVNIALFIISIQLHGVVFAFPHLIILASCIGFLYYNFYPAKIFPGNSGTFAMGGFTAAFAMINGLHIPLFLLFIPHLFDFAVKFQVSFKVKDYGHAKHGEDGIIYPPGYNSLISILLKRFRLTELKLVLLLWLIELFLSIIIVFYTAKVLF